MEKILILGSEGQIGKHLCDYLSIRQFEIYKFDIVKDGSFDLRVENNHKLISIIDKVDVVIFLAFDVGGSRYLNQYQNTYEFIENNIAIMFYTFKVIKNYEKKLIFASSQMSNMNDSSYGVLKRLGEFYSHSLDAIIVKPWNVYGFENDLDKFHVISDFLYMSLKNGKIEMITNGEEYRDFLFVDDFCDAILMIIKNYELIDKRHPIDLASFSRIKIIDLALLVKAIFSENGINIDIIKGVKEDYTHSYKTNIPQNSLVEWVPKTKLYDGIKYVLEKMLDDGIID